MPTPTPTHQWLLDGDGNNLVGSVHLAGVGSPTFGAGKSGQALNSASGKYLSVSSGIPTAMTAPPLTVAGWVNLSSASGNNGPILHIASTGATGGIQATFGVTSTGKLRYGYRKADNSGNKFANSVASIGWDAWHHIAATVDVVGANVTIKLYIDGALVSTIANATGYFVASGASKVQIGTLTSSHLVGKIDDVRFYDSVLSAAEIAEVMLTSRYEIFKRDAVDGKDTLVATKSADELTHTITGLAADSVGYYWVRAVSRCNVADVYPVISRLRRVALDGLANLIPPAPNAPYNLRLVASADGAVTAHWAYRGDGAEAVADRFFIYLAVGAAMLDFSSATDAVIGVRASNSFNLGTFQDGQIVRCAVRAATEANVPEGNTVEATTVADRTAPAVPESLTVSAEAS